MNTQFNKGVVEMCVLVLVNQKDRYGYELVELISKQIEISEGAIYPILRRLTQDKYFTTYLQESSEGPPRKYYQVTQEGRAQTKRILQEWTQFTSNVDKILKGEKTND